MKFLRYLICLFVLSLAAVAQTTIVTATVTDSTGQAFANASWRAELLPPFGNPQVLTLSGVPIPASQMVFTGVMDGTGFFTVTLSDNTLITPTGTLWKFTICSNTSAPCFFSYQVVHNATQNLSASLSADSVIPAVTAANNIPRAYKDAEVLGSEGGIYWDVELNVLKGCLVSPCNGSNFVIIGPGGGGGGGATFQVNGVNTTSQTTINFINGTVINGITPTFSNPSAGQVQLGLSGTLQPTGGGTGLNSGTANGIPYWNTNTSMGLTAAGGVGTNCLQETNGGAPTFGPCNTGSIGGSGASPFLAKFTAATTLGSSVIKDNGVANPNVTWAQQTNGGDAFTLARNTDTVPTGTLIKFTTAGGSVVCQVDVTGTLGSCAVPASLLTGTVATGNLPATIVYNNQANTYTTGLQDFTLATLKVPNSGGAAPTTDALIAFDTTSHKFKGGSNGTTGTFLFDSRLVSTTSPLSGGGALSADLTLSCPTCVTSVSGTANQISSTGGTTPVLSLTAPVILPGGLTLGGNLALNSFGITNGYTNDATGTTANLLVTYTSSSTVKTMTAGATSGFFGVCASGCSTSGTAQIAQSGIVNLIADNTVTANDYLIPGSTTAGRTKSNGTTYPGSIDFVGIALSGATAGGTFTAYLHPPELKPGGASGASTGDTFITLSANADLTAERNINPRDNLKATDGGAKGNYSIDWTPTDTTVQWEHDSFCGGGTGTTSIGDLGWTVNNISGINTNSKIYTDTNHLCAQRLTTGAAAGAGQGLALPGTNIIQSPHTYSNSNFDLVWVFRINQTTNTRFRIGMVDSPSAVQPNNGDWLRYDTNASFLDTQFIYETRAASTSTTSSSSVNADTSFHKLEITSNAGGTGLIFTLDGAHSFTSTTNLPTANMTFSMLCVNDTTATAGTCDANFFAFKIRGLSR